VTAHAFALYIAQSIGDDNLPVIPAWSGHQFISYLAKERSMGSLQFGSPPQEVSVMKIWTDESGQALIMSALCMACLIGFVALATDVGVLLREKRLAQIAADAGAIAGAGEYNYGGTTTAATNSVTANGFTAGTGTTVTVNSPPKNGPHASASPNGYVEVIVQQVQPALFRGLLGLGSITVAARAVANANGTTNGCVYTLGTSGPDISLTGNANIQVTTCGIIDNSSSSNALSMNGNVTLDAQSIGVVGGVSKVGNITLSPTPVTGVVPTSDPLAFLTAPTVPTTCSADPGFSGNVTKTLTPGCYTGLSASGNVNLTLSPGLYVINGTFSLGGNVTLTGTGVTLDLLGSSSFPGNTALNLTAPTSGTYNGVLIYQPLTNPNSLSLKGNSGATFEGIVYAPGAAVDFTGNSGTNLYTDFVVKSLSLVGNASFNSYASINGNSVLSAVRLVE
jgi:Flp pilus assembly protein TadG